MSFELPTRVLDAAIAIVPVEWLQLHEEVIGTHVDELCDAIERDGLLRDPVIVDRDTNVVLDGMHRVTAIRGMDLTGIPVCLVDYRDPAIEVGSWIREFDGLDPDRLRDRCAEAGLRVQPVDPETDPDRSWPAPPVIVTESNQFELTLPDGSPRAVLDRTMRVVETLRSTGIETHRRPDTAFASRSPGQPTLVIPSPDKAAIIRAAEADDPFPPNTSRHVIPTRPVGVNVPLDRLEGDHRRATATLTSELNERPFERLPPGSQYAGRTYEEELLVFR